MKNHRSTVHEGKKPFSSCQSSDYKRNKQIVKSPKDGYKNQNKHDHFPKKHIPYTSQKAVKNGNSAKNGNQQQSWFRAPNFVKAPNFVNGQVHPQALSYSSVLQEKFSPQVSASGNEPAAAAHQPLNRGSQSNQNWGQQVDQNQIQMIAEILLQLVKRNQ